jgi:hypothetical protein
MVVDWSRLWESRRDLVNLTDLASCANRRPRVRWEATHANGWVAVIVEQNDGHFAGWAMSGEQHTSTFVSNDIDHTHAAGVVLLARETGHRTCTASCSDWRLLMRDEARIAE